MLKVRRDDFGNFSTYNVISVYCSNIDNDENRINIKVNTQMESLDFYVWTDSNTNAQDAANRLASSVSKEIEVTPYVERDYLYIVDTTLSDDDMRQQIKASGRITN